MCKYITDWRPGDSVDVPGLVSRRHGRAGLRDGDADRCRSVRGDQVEGARTVVVQVSGARAVLVHGGAFPEPAERMRRHGLRRRRRARRARDHIDARPTSFPATIATFTLNRSKVLTDFFFTYPSDFRPTLPCL